MENIVNLYCIFDKRLEYYYTPLPGYHDKEIMKDMLNLVMDNNTIMHNNPEYFDLYCVGQFDITTGHIEPCLRLICNFTDLLPKEVINE